MANRPRLSASSGHVVDDGHGCPGALGDVLGEDAHPRGYLVVVLGGVPEHTEAVGHAVDDGQDVGPGQHGVPCGQLGGGSGVDLGPDVVEVLTDGLGCGTEHQQAFGHRGGV